MIMLGTGRRSTLRALLALPVRARHRRRIYARAMSAGATSILEPTDMFYGDRNAGVKDASRRPLVDRDAQGGPHAERAREARRGRGPGLVLLLRRRAAADDRLDAREHLGRGACVRTRATPAFSWSWALRVAPRIAVLTRGFERHQAIES